MSHHDKRSEEHAEEHPQTALEEVLDEVEDAGTRTHDTAGERRHRGEAGEAVTPNTGAQEQSRGE